MTTIDPDVRVGRSIATGVYELTLDELADLVVVGSYSVRGDDPTTELVRRCWAELAVIDREVVERAFQRFVGTLPDPLTALAVAEIITNTTTNTEEQDT